MLNIKIRVLVQENVRQLKRAPGSIDVQTIEKDRDTLTSLISQLKQAQQDAGVVEINGKAFNRNEDLETWDDIIYEPVVLDEATGTAEASVPTQDSMPGQKSKLRSKSGPAQNGPVHIEDQILSLPSNGNIDSIHHELEHTHRISLAEQRLNQIRNLIAEKSFQFSHLIHRAPCKSVTTRSRSTVKKINEQMALHCRMYSRCRSRLVELGADTATLARLRVLSPHDIGTSTAIIKPNMSGSSSIKLSWIWETSGGHRFGLAGINLGENMSATGADIGADTGAGERLIECEY